jgi:rhodanese-related sulfurtransferase
MPDEDLRITAEELKQRMAAGESFTVLDSRNPNAWAGRIDQARGALRADVHEGFDTLPPIPRDRAVVAYCT